MKSKRQSAICKLITEYEIDTQDELVSKLQEIGFNVTQATVSRDIRELRLTKIVGENGNPKYALPKEDNDDEAPLKARRLSRVLLEGFLSCEQAGNIVVIHTMSGMANAVAAALDSLHMTEIVGTIAGDDTIFMAVRTIEDGKKLKQKVQELTSGRDV